MSGLLRVTRALALVGYNIAFLLLGLVSDAAFFLTEDRNLRIKAHCMMWWARGACLILGIRRTSTGACGGDSALFVTSNHCSYLDILVIGSIMPSVFIAKKEVAAWGLLGRLARLGGTIFVDRESKAASIRKLDEIKKRLSSGISVVVFPEGTTNDGTAIKDFKSSFFQVPVDTGVPVLPLSLLYSHINGVPVDSGTKDTIAWYADMPFLSHFWHLMGMRRIDARIHFSPRIHSTISDRKSLTSFAYQAVNAGHAALRREIEA